MTAKKWDGAVYTDLTVGKKWDGVSWVDLTVAKKWNGVAYEDIPLPGGGSPGLSLSVSSTNVIGTRVTDCTPAFVSVLSSPLTTVTATGGTGGGPTYSWAQVSGDAGISATLPTSAGTRFTATVGCNQDRSAIWRCTVTRGVEVKTIDVNVSLSHFDGGPA